MKTKKMIYVSVILLFVLLTSVGVASIVEYYGRIEGIIDVDCDPEYAWCDEDNNAIGCDESGNRTVENCLYGCFKGVCLVPTPTPTPIPTPSPTPGG